MRRQTLGGLTALLVSCAQAVAGQSLADLARAQEARSGQAPGKHYTNNDLRPEPARSATTTGAPVAGTPVAPAAAAPGADATSAATDPATAATPAGGQPDKLKDPRDENYWRSRMAELRARVARLRGEIAAFEGRLAALDAQPGDAGVRERGLTLASLATRQRDLVSFEEEVGRWQQRARQANVPSDCLK